MDLSPHLRHQSSLSKIINLSSFEPSAPLEAGQRARTRDKFYHIVKHFEAANTNDTERKYCRPALVRLTYENSRSDESKDMFLRAFFSIAALSMDSEDHIDLGDLHIETDIRSALFNFADYLFDNFFLPRKPASSNSLLPLIPHHLLTPPRR